MAGAIQFEGLAELQRAFRIAGAGIARDFREGLKSAAEPVRQDAERLAHDRISGMRRGVIPWHSMRTGVTRNSVYVAPARRGRGRGDAARRRPILAGLLGVKAMEPALEQNRERVIQEVEDVLDDLARMWARV